MGKGEKTRRGVGSVVRLGFTRLERGSGTEPRGACNSRGAAAGPPHMRWWEEGGESGNEMGRQFLKWLLQNFLLMSASKSVTDFRVMGPGFESHICRLQVM